MILCLVFLGKGIEHLVVVFGQIILVVYVVEPCCKIYEYNESNPDIQIDHFLLILVG